MWKWGYSKLPRQIDVTAELVREVDTPIFGRIRSLFDDLDGDGYYSLPPEQNPNCTAIWMNDVRAGEPCSDYQIVGDTIDVNGLILLDIGFMSMRGGGRRYFATTVQQPLHANSRLNLMPGCQSRLTGILELVPLEWSSNLILLVGRGSKKSRFLKSGWTMPPSCSSA